MDVKKAILTRRSIRAFKPQPVPAEVLQEILRVAAWSPSGMNIQPWYLCVASGQSLENLKQALAERSKVSQGSPEMPWYNLGEAHNERRRRLGMRVLGAKGIAREDKAKRAEWNQQMLRFFDAPSVIIVCSERSLGAMVAGDLGIISMSIMLVAHSYGLGTCPMGIASSYPDVVRKALGIPDDRMIFLAMPIGYPDLDAPVNKFERERLPIESFVQWRS